MLVSLNLIEKSPMNFIKIVVRLASSLLTVNAMLASGHAYGSETKSTRVAEETITIHMTEVNNPADVFSMIDRLDLSEDRDPSMVSRRSDPSSSFDSIDQIINIGKQIWDIIKENQPVVDIKYQYANAIPKGAESRADLSDFSDLQAHSYRIWGTNPYGMTVYDLTFTAVHQYGGRYQGKGQYLETVSIVPSHISALWGYTVNYLVDSVSVVNGGTSEEPIAKLTLNAKFKVKTIIKSEEVNTMFHFRGDSPSVQSVGI